MRLLLLTSPPSLRSLKAAPTHISFHHRQCFLPKAFRGLQAQPRQRSLVLPPKILRLTPLIQLEVETTMESVQEARTRTISVVYVQSAMLPRSTVKPWSRQDSSQLQSGYANMQPATRSIHSAATKLHVFTEPCMLDVNHLKHRERMPDFPAGNMLGSWSQFFLSFERDW